jgi:L-ribulose-5-phosphate 3-epimerase
MVPAINVSMFPTGTDAPTLAGAARQAGFEAVELVMSVEGLCTPAATQEQCRDLARVFQEAGLRIASLGVDLPEGGDYAHPDPAVRHQARERTVAGLDRATWLDTDAIRIMPAVVGLWNEPCPRVGYADALARSYDMLVQLREEAEDHGVAIAIENAPNRFLLSPVEMRDLIDRINSPWVGAYLDIGSAMAVGYPQDWIDVLGRRILRVRARDYDLRRPGPAGFECPLHDGSVDWPAVMTALRRAGYDGPLTYEGQGDPADIAARLRRILIQCG